MGDVNCYATISNKIFELPPVLPLNNVALDFLRMYNTGLGGGGVTCIAVNFLNVYWIVILSQCQENEKDGKRKGQWENLPCKIV